MNVDTTTQNDDLETNATNDDSTTESEGQASETRTYTEAELNERLEAERKERDKRWRERIKAAGGEEGGEKGSKKADSKEVVSDEVTIARLEARGILDSDIQNYLFTAAKREGKTAVELLSDSYFADKIAAMKRDKEQEAARPTPSSRTATNDRSNDLGYWLKQAEKGQLPTDAAMRRKVIAKLSGR
jgi:hypothetical protein